MEEKELREFLLEELKLFKDWSGPYLVKILADIEEFGNEPLLLGSGGLLKYKNRYFVITNEHVVRRCSDLENQVNIPYTVGNSSYKMTVLSAVKNSQDDIAVIEIQYNQLIGQSNHRFLDSDFIEFDINGFFEKTNVVFCHGYPYYSSNINRQRREIIAETLPYCTFVAEFNESDNELILYADQNGVNEYGEQVSITHYGGMSGSFVYGYYHKSLIPYKCLGVLTMWGQGDETLSVYTMNEFIDFIEKHFFI